MIASALADFRAHFPIFRHRVYVNSCSQGALSTEVERAVQAYLESWHEQGSPWEHWVEVCETLRIEYAALIGASPDEIAIYYAAAKTLALVSFVYFAVSAASAHKFSAYFEAGDRDRLRVFLADAIRWTFWPSLAATALVLACGWPLLWLFGETFVTGYSLMFVLSVGVLARAAIGPGERFLSMLGEQKACALAALVALLTNIALCFSLIPSYGAFGAAVSTSIAFVMESVLIFVIAKRRLDFHLFFIGGRG